MMMMIPAPKLFPAVSWTFQEAQCTGYLPFVSPDLCQSPQLCQANFSTWPLLWAKLSPLTRPHPESC